MQLISLIIDRQGTYGRTNDIKDPLKAAIKIQGQSHTTEMQLTEEVSVKIIQLVAEEIAIAARETAATMSSQLLQIPASVPGQKTLQQVIEDDKEPFSAPSSRTFPDAVPF